LRTKEGAARVEALAVIYVVRVRVDHDQSSTDEMRKLRDRRKERAFSKLRNLESTLFLPDQGFYTLERDARSRR